MRKVVLAAFMCLATTGVAFAQDKPVDVNVGFGVALPVGALNDDLQAACMDALQISPQACVAFAARHTWQASARVFVEHALNVRDTDVHGSVPALGSEGEVIKFVAEDPHFAA